MRKENSIINILYAYGGQLFGIIVSFFSRIVFIKILNSEYLGLNSFFTNIVSILALAELGVGAAMAFNLYEPLAKKDEKKIKALMNFYKKAYTTIGIFIFILGIILIPFLKFFMNEVPNIQHIYWYYILFVINASVSYFFTYKRTLIVSDQKRYIATFFRYLFYTLLHIAQILVLIITHNYTLFLICQILFTIIENICISRKTDKLYPYIKEKNNEQIDKETYNKIYKDIKAMFMNRFGVTVLKFTDNIVISKFLGVIEVGIYSNYQMITTSITTIITQIFTSITASVGNFNVTESKEKLEKLFYKIFFMNFWIYLVISVCLMTVMNPFIKLWVGEEYVLDILVVFAIIFNFYFSGIRLSITTIKDALGIYWRDRYRPVVTAIVNLIVSIILVKNIGLIGVILGTIVSTIFVDLVVEPYVLYKYTFSKNVLEYYKRYFLYVLLLIVIGIMAICICSKIILESNILDFILKGIVTFVFSNLMLIILFHRTEEFKYMKNIMNTTIGIIKRKLKIGEKNDKAKD